MRDSVDIVQEAASKRACEIEIPVALAMRGSGQFSLIFRLLRELQGDDWTMRYPQVRERAKKQLADALDEICVIAMRLRERIP